MAELWITIIGTITAVITVTLTNFFANRSKLKNDERALKEQYYINYLKALSNNATSGHTGESKLNLSTEHNKLLLVGSVGVVKALEEFTEYISPENDNRTKEKHDKLLTVLIKSMREDVFSSNKKFNKDYPVVKLRGTKK